MKNEKKIRAVAEEAVTILRDNPELKYYEAIHKAKEVLKDESNLGKLNQRSNTKTGS